jgi:lysophospholipase L1-like esterase
MREAQRERRGDRRRLLTAATLLFPFLFFAALELGLRLAGFGGSYPLFVEAEGLPGHLQANPEAIQRFFSRAPELAIDPIPFKQQKPPGGYRIVVQGDSTAAGFPYGRFAGLAGMLGDRLEATFPDREIEVISTAMAAVTSYTLLDFVDEIIAIEPDAVLIYVGHNEYLGILGVGSALRSARFRRATLLHLELGRLRLYQLLSRLLSDARILLAERLEAPGASRGTLISRAATGARIPFGSDAYRRGLRQLEDNLGEILERYRRAGIRVYVGTLASNEKDRRPFSSPVPDRIDREAWDGAWRAHRQAREAGDLASARDALSRLLELDPDGADAWYALGRLEQEAGRIDAARDAYRKAVDRDQLRLRAPQAFNGLIRRLARRHGARLVDVQKHLADASPQGLLGHELLLEHVHPNAEGYFHLADAYYEALKQQGEIGEWSGAPSRAQAMRDMPITAIDRILGEYALRELEAAYPFSETQQEVRFPPPRDEVERLAWSLQRGELAWLDAMERLMQLYREANRSEEAAVVARIAAQAHPTLSAPNFSAGLLYLQLKRFARARRYLERSLLLLPDDAATLRALVLANLGLEDEPRARELLSRLKRIAPSDPLVRRFERRQTPAPPR